MKLSWAAKALLAAGTVIGLAGFLVIVDLGVGAGRVHSGVSVAGYDVGSLTQKEAFQRLSARASDLAQQPILFVSDTHALNFSMLPTDVGWAPRPFDTAEAAMAVGRKGGLLGAAGDRLDAWFGGVEIQWRAGIDQRAIGRLLDLWEIQAEAVGADLDRKTMRRRIVRAIVILPREFVPIPLEG